MCMKMTHKTNKNLGNNKQLLGNKIEEIRAKRKATADIKLM